MNDASYVHIIIMIRTNVVDNLNSVQVINKPCVCTRTMRLSSVAALQSDREHVYLDLENPGGSGFWVRGYMSQGREMGKLVYEHPGNEVDGSCHSKEGSK